MVTHLVVPNLAVTRYVVFCMPSPTLWSSLLLCPTVDGRQQPSHGGEATGVARADSWSFEDVFHEADTLELAPPLGKPEFKSRIRRITMRCSSALWRTRP